MKLFGQFLIDEGLITPEDFVGAMITQAERLPSLAMAIYELKLFSVQQQMEIFNYQTTHFREYRTSCIEMGIWDEFDVEHAVGRYFVSRLKPIGEILVEQGRLTLDQLSAVLEKYVALGEETYLEPERPAPPKLSLVRKDEPLKNGPYDFKGAFTADAEKRLYSLYCGKLDKDTLESISSYYSQSPDTSRRLAHDSLLKTLSEAAHFIQAMKSQKLLRTLLSVSSPESLKPQEAAFVEQAIQLLWVLREGLNQGIPEIVSLASAGLDSRTDELCFILSKIGQTA